MQIVTNHNAIIQKVWKYKKTQKSEVNIVTNTKKKHAFKAHQTKEWETILNVS